MINHPNAAIGAAESRGNELLADAERLARAEYAFRQAIGDSNGLPFGSRSVRRAVRMPLALESNQFCAKSPAGPRVRGPRPRLSGSRLLARFARLGLRAAPDSPLTVETSYAARALESHLLPEFGDIADPAQAGKAA